ncbi:hypothetical protein AJ85_05770 [Alkalihalobacillus alcalophilus ATCC 27647 = CGMCC 1.3604]|uniref:Uncharacterized protein n=1 Tax=Alkalihalobacillus alcalophilus ATCC 27647 = CGMCC 1.3604 TaxID=1218173 RepID=A0A094WLN2_ALKAL|nr:hypothetical protein [Alkalihalobacillus alcalophilus]YP_009276818.1 hypothetical protein BH791_gp12 [Bacillus phage BalMu-1]AJA42390.1 hypothetical protein BalMu1_B12 [Bacillus phage BalMu-1]AJA42446.1 hypothetical protein BalMu1_A12 [Bacillus phage BalMu-1]KGA96848.1 hypothetical protein BALCAV_0213580 [Alkalihalobacillus alcalophilus ATCC 27647 = CGMCC 1.3604]MED1561135.1 hypothetical protein [Alkalihalobacillus alcalophilus]THG91331.1 hypothetical protein AJ85_05770 [Alkalihalobacillus
MLLKRLYEVKESIGQAIAMKTPNEEIENARKELFLAWHEFDNAAPAFVDKAIKNLLLAENKFASLIASENELRDCIFDADANAQQCSMYRTLSISKVMEFEPAQ